MSPNSLCHALRRVRTQRNFLLRRLLSISSSCSCGHVPVPARLSRAKPLDGMRRSAASRSSGVTEKAKLERQQLAAFFYNKLLSLIRPHEDVPHIINRFILLLHVEARGVLRGLAAMSQEIFLAQRDLVKELETIVLRRRKHSRSTLRIFSLRVRLSAKPWSCRRSGAPMACGSLSFGFSTTRNTYMIHYLPSYTTYASSAT
eukprot:4902106-Pleurochrysis_carterae.AAC.2